MKSFKDLSFDEHSFLAKFLTSNDCVSLAQTCSSLRDVYTSLKWKHCFVLNDTYNKQLLTKSKVFRSIPLSAVYKPHNFPWIPANIIKTLEFDNPFMVEKKSVHSIMPNSPFPKDAFSQVTTVIINYRPEDPKDNDSFLETFLMELSSNIKNIRLIFRQQRIIKYYDHESESIDFSQVWDTEYDCELEFNKKDSQRLLSKNNSSSLNNLSWVSKKALFIIDKFNGFVYNATLSGEISTIYFSWCAPKVLYPFRDIYPTVIALCDILPESFPSLKKCVFETTAENFSESSPDRNPITPVTIPIVTHLLLHSEFLNICDFETCFKFPNLKFMSLCLTDIDFTSWKELPDPLTANSATKWNSPSILEIVVSHKCAMHAKIYGILNYLLVSLGPKRLKVTMNTHFIHHSGSFFRPASHQLRKVLEKKESFKKFKSKIQSSILQVLGDDRKQNIPKQTIDFFSHTIEKSFTNPFMLSEIYDYSRQFSQYQISLDSIIPTLVMECIFRVANQSQSLEYIHLDVWSFASRYFSPALNDLINLQVIKQTKQSPSIFKKLIPFLKNNPDLNPINQSVKQVLLTLRVPEKEFIQPNSPWYNDLPEMTIRDIIIGYKQFSDFDHRIVQVCYDLKNPRKVFGREEVVNESSDSLWGNTMLEDNFAGWY